MSDTKWKDTLLKSSLPFEHLVAADLAKNNWYVWGQYSYPRTNESGISTDFSVDLRASKEYSNDTHWLATLDILIECKYASPGVKWIFLPYPETSELFSGMVKVFDQAANKRVTSHKPLEVIEGNMPYCIRGISLYDSGFDENAISRGASQLRYAMPRVAEGTFDSHATAFHDEDIFVTFACAILVTTAPIYCLKHGLSLGSLYKAKSLDDVVEETKAVIMWEPSSPDREKYANEIYKLLPPGPLEQRIRKYASVFSPSKKCKYPPYEFDARIALRESGSHVLVINYKYLIAMLKSLDAAAGSAIKKIEKIAEVTYNPTAREPVISRIKSSLKL